MGGTGSTFVRSEWDSDHRRQAEVERFLGQPSAHRLVFGTGALARRLAAVTDAGGFLDDYRAGEKVDERPVLVPESASGRVVANGVILGNPFTAADRIREVGAVPIDYLAFVRAGLVPFPVIGDGFIGELSAHAADYEAIYRRLADERSRETFAAIVNTRVHMDIRFMSGFTNRQSEQYFEPFLGLRAEGEVFADVGSFDGATSLAFAERVPTYRHIHALEPSPLLAGEVTSRLRGLRDVTVHTVGAGDRDGSAAFESAGSASRVVTTGPDRIEIRRLHGLLEPPPTFVKMDIEGQEIPAIRGAAELIRRSHPKLAVCCYHLLNDLRSVVAAVDKLNPSYELFLRHYTEGVTESVYFFVPR